MLGANQGLLLYGEVSVMQAVQKYIADSKRFLPVRDLPPPCCVLEQDTLLPDTLLPRKRWLRPDKTEKLLTGTLILNTTNQRFLPKSLFFDFCFSLETSA